MKAVAEEILSCERETALIRLLDDPSPMVQAALMAEFKRLGPSGRLLLEKCISVVEGDKRKRARDILEELFGPDPSRMFMEFIGSLQYELETGLILVNRIEDPEVPIKELRGMLDSLADRCHGLMVHPVSPVEQCRIINRVLFHEQGFRGEKQYQEDPSNSCLEAVLKCKKGSATLLSSIYILVAQRLGIDLEPIAVPHRLMVGCFQTDWPVYIDPFKGGHMRTLEEMYTLLQEMEIEPKMHHLAPSPVSDVLSRVCGELAQSHVHEQKLPRAVLFESFVRAFDKTHQERDEA